MPRRKAAVNCVMLPWLSARGDCKEGRFCQIGNSLLLSRQFQALTQSARWLYICMTMESGGKREFTFTHGAGRKYGVKSSSYDRALKELKTAGFVESISDAEMSRFSPGQFRFSFRWKSHE